MWIGGEEIFGCAMEIGEVAAASARDKDFFADAIGEFKDGDATATITGFDSAHEACGAGAEN